MNLPEIIIHIGWILIYLMIAGIGGFLIGALIAIPFCLTNIRNELVEMRLLMIRKLEAYNINPNFRQRK